MGGSVKPCIHKQLAENACILRGGGRKVQGGGGQGAAGCPSPTLPAHRPAACANMTLVLPRVAHLAERAASKALVPRAQLKDKPAAPWAEGKK